jgi:hypothetical protein
VCICQIVLNRSHLFFQMFGLLVQFVNSRVLPSLCEPRQLQDYLEDMNNQTFLLTGGYELFRHWRPLPNLYPSKSCPDPQSDASVRLQDRSACPWYYRYKPNELRFPRYILTAVPKTCYNHQHRGETHCRDFSGRARLRSGIIPNGICEKIEIEVLTYWKHQKSDQCYTIGPRKQNVTIAYGCVYRRTQ